LTWPGTSTPFSYSFPTAPSSQSVIMSSNMSLTQLSWANYFANLYPIDYGSDRWTPLSVNPMGIVQVVTSTADNNVALVGRDLWRNNYFKFSSQDIQTQISPKMCCNPSTALFAAMYTYGTVIEGISEWPYERMSEYSFHDILSDVMLSIQQRMNSSSSSQFQSNLAALTIASGTKGYNAEFEGLNAGNSYQSNSKIVDSQLQSSAQNHISKTKPNYSSGFTWLSSLVAPVGAQLLSSSTFRHAVSQRVTRFFGQQPNGAFDASFQTAFAIIATAYRQNSENGQERRDHSRHSAINHLYGMYYGPDYQPQPGRHRQDL